MSLGEFQAHIDIVTVSTTDSTAIAPATPIEIYSVGWVSGASIDAVFVLTINHEEADGTDVAPTGVAEGGTMTSTAATYAPNKGAYKIVSSAVTGKPIVVLPGERLEVIVTDASPTAGTIQVTVLYRLLPQVDVTTERASDALVPGATTTTTTLGNMTLVTA